MHILRREPSGLGNVFLDCQQVSDQPHAELQGNSPPGNKLQTHTQRRKKKNQNQTCMEHRILTLGIGGLSTPLPSHQQQPAAATAKNNGKCSTVSNFILNPTVSVGLSFETLSPSPNSYLIV